MPANALIEAVLRQEQALVFPAFDEQTAHDTGEALRAEALARKAPVVVEIRTAARKLYFAALPGSSGDNDEWARRKGNLVLRTNTSSFRMGLQLKERGRPAWPDAGFDPKDFSDSGGGFPVTVKGTGVVAVICVSGLPARDDHELITSVLAKRLGVTGVALPE
jgi:uncharacterized protein (UPF0303 family)